MWLYTLLLILLVVVLWGVFRWKHVRFYQLARKIGCDPNELPIIGLIHMAVGSGEVVGEPVLAEYISKACLEKDDVMRKCFQPVLGNTNFNAPVPIWRVRRKYLVPPFSPKYLKTFVKMFSEQSQLFADILKPSTGKTVALFDYAFKYATENLCQTTLGVALDLQKFPHHTFIDGLEKLSYTTGERFFKPWLQIDFLYKLLPAWKLVEDVMQYNDEFVNKIISTKKEEMQNKLQSGDTREKVKPFLEQIIEAAGDGVYGDLELKEETIGVTIAGMDTSASAIGFVAAMLAQHPDVQEKVYEEITEVFEGDEPVRHDHLTRLPYLDAVVKETLRLFPPVPVITRQADRDTKLPNGVVLPAGTAIIIHLWAINRHPEYWGPDAEEFKPERFLNFTPKHDAQLATFSMGPRACVGFKYAAMSLATLITTLLRRYRFSAAPRNGPAGACEEDGLRLNYAISMKETNNFPILLLPRKS
ncbi:cytochrome p450 domain-containing protein [Phthorimaea operculella]|nr:cytochrome p450 domain-containing protein [Phthorimaea operculella]